MTGKKIILDAQTFKALSVETRLQILKELSTKPQTLTELATSLELNPSTIKEHLEKLLEAELVSIEDTTRKWKFYSLTRKGEKIIQPEEVNVLFAFSFSLLSTLTLGAVWLRERLAPVEEEIQPFMVRVASEADQVASEALHATSTIVPTITLILIISITLTILAGSYLLYKKRK